MTNVYVINTHTNKKTLRYHKIRTDAHKTKKTHALSQLSTQSGMRMLVRPRHLHALVFTVMNGATFAGGYDLLRFLACVSYSAVRPARVLCFSCRTAERANATSKNRAYGLMDDDHCRQLTDLPLVARVRTGV